MISDIVKTTELMRDQMPPLALQLSAFNKLQNLEEFRDCFNLEIEILIKDFKKHYHQINQEASQMCTEIVVNNLDSFQRIKLTINEAGEKVRGDVEDHPIAQFLKAFIKSIPIRYKD